MSQSKLIFKLAAVASSVILVGGFVAYRAGAFDWISNSFSPPAQSSDAADNVPDNAAESAQQPLAEGADGLPVMLSTSKSAMFVVPPGSQAGKSTGTAPPPPPAIMGGSKSLAPIVPPKPPANQAPAPSQSPSPRP